MIKINFIQNVKNNINFWDFLLFLAIFVFFIQHLYFGNKHFHDCDSVITFDYMRDSSLESMKSHIISITPQFLLKIRLSILDYSQKISFLPVKSFFELPYITTYTPAIGLLFGGFINYSFEKFYQICQF